MKYLLTILFLCPFFLFAQGVVGEVDQMHNVLENIYQEMMPLCSQMLRVAQTIACFGALLYIGYRVWKQMASAEPIDFFPLLRPFALSIGISIFPSVIATINGILSPVTLVTKSLVQNTHADVDRLLHQRDLASQGKGPKELITAPGGQAAWDQYGAQDSSGGFWSSLLALDFSQLFKMLVATVLEILYYAASLCIDCMRSFHMIILAILGPLVFAIAVFDGFQHTLAIWFARYINIYLWLPIANLFGAMIAKIQASMLQLDIAQMQQGEEGMFSGTDMAYLIFMIIGIIGYVSIPSIANYVVHASGGSAIMSKVNSIVSSQLGVPMSMGSFGGGGSGGNSGGGGMSNNLPGNDQLHSSMASAANSEGFQSGKISGN
jgi:conjugative transposon TraJ protein